MRLKGASLPSAGHPGAYLTRLRIFQNGDIEHGCFNCIRTFSLCSLSATIQKNNSVGLSGSALKSPITQWEPELENKNLC